ncbi:MULTISPECIES: hypothetical protein [unclassified Fischerella]|uniref:hypothetical protein n=1 Tax=unclassified Fischerella TaxID=494603 RepID=UPI002F360900
MAKRTEFKQQIKEVLDRFIEGFESTQASTLDIYTTFKQGKTIMNYEKPIKRNPQETEPRQYKPRPRIEEEGEPQPCQHLRLLDCNKPVSRAILECYHCHEGLLCEYKNVLPVQDIDVRCPTCGKIAIKLVGQEVLSTTVIPSPWR